MTQNGTLGSPNNDLQLHPSPVKQTVQTGAEKDFESQLSATELCVQHFEDPKSRTTIGTSDEDADNESTEEVGKKRPLTDEDNDRGDGSSGEEVKRKKTEQNEDTAPPGMSPITLNTPTTTGETTPSSASQVNLPSWVRTIPSTHTSLSEDQITRLEQAKAFARDMQAMLVAKQAILLTQKSATLSHPLPAMPVILSPGVTGGGDPRVINMMSRVYVGSIPFEVTDQHIRVVFHQFGHINNVGMNLDSTTGKHKGYCFVEYEVPEGAVLALGTMDGFELGGRKLKVGRPNNFQPQSATSLLPAPKSRIYVSNVSEYVTEENISSIFEAFGTISKCILIPDFATRKHKSYGYIDFEDEAAAQTAVESMNNFDLGGLQLHVILAVLGGTMGEGMKALDRVPALPGATAVLASAANTATPAIGLSAGALAAHTTAARIASDLANKGQVISNETVAREENLSISSSQRYAIMQALARTDASPVLLVRNAVAASEVDDELREEFAEECTKFGRVTRVHVHVDQLSLGEGLGEEDGRKQGDGDVRIFVQFVDAGAAEKARSNLDGRWFGGRRIKATLYDSAKFHAGDYTQ